MLPEEGFIHDSQKNRRDPSRTGSEDKDYLPRKVFEAALQAGTILMTGGAEAFRVENTVTHIMKTVDGAEIHVVALMTGLYASMKTAEGDYITSLTRIRERSWDLKKIQTVNNLSRAFTEKKISLDLLKDRMDRLNRENKSALITDLAWIFTGAFFVLLLAGSGIDFLTSVLASGILVSTKRALGYEQLFSSFISTFVSGFILALAIGLLINLLFVQADRATVISGTLVTLYPGIMLSNGIRDIMQGDTLTGIGFLTQAVFTAISLSMGSGLGILLTGGQLL